MPIIRKQQSQLIPIENGDGTDDTDRNGALNILVNPGAIHTASITATGVPSP